MAKKSVRRSVAMTQEMHNRLAQLVSKQSQDVTEADLIREAIRRYLDEQEDLIGSRRHFQKSLRQRVDQLENAVGFQLNVLIYLLAEDDQQIETAILNALRGGDILLAKMKAVRELKELWAMSKAIIVVDFAYKGPKRKGRGTGHKGLSSTLKYLQYRDNRTDHVTQDSG